MIADFLPDNADDCFAGEEVAFDVSRTMGLDWRHDPIVFMTGRRWVRAKWGLGLLFYPKASRC
jgi:hypothetical protein